MKKNKTNTHAELPFEEALAQLEKIVEGLEEGTLGLDKSLTAFEEGMRLAKFCEDRLSQAQTRIEKIVKQWDGTHSIESMNADSDNTDDEDNHDI